MNFRRFLNSTDVVKVILEQVLWIGKVKLFKLVRSELVSRDLLRRDRELFLVQVLDHQMLLESLDLDQRYDGAVGKSDVSTAKLIDIQLDHL